MAPQGLRERRSRSRPCILSPIDPGTAPSGTLKEAGEFHRPYLPRRRWRRSDRPSPPINGHFRLNREGNGRSDCSALKWKSIKVTVELPDDLSAALKGRWDDVPRRALEAIAVDAYRTGALTENQLRRLLQLPDRFQVHALLKEHRVPLRYTEADLEDDLRAQRELGVLPDR